jgi:hypothetical protein
MNEYCTEYVNDMGRSAEGPFVYLGVLFLVLGCHGLTIFLDRRDDVALSFYETSPLTSDLIDFQTPVKMVKKFDEENNEEQLNESPEKNDQLG